MIPFKEVVYAPVGYLIRIGVLLLLMAQICIVVLAFARRRRAAFTAFTLLQLSVTFVLLLLFADGTYYPEHLPPRKSMLPLVKEAYGTPWVYYIILIAVLASAAAYCAYNDARFIKSRPSFASVKEAIDDLPVGVCFIAENGTVTLFNLQMDAWCRRITGQTLADGDSFLRKLKTVGEEQNGQLLLRLSEDCVLLFAAESVLVDGRRYRQLTAADITEQFRVTSELEKHNARLKDITVRMKAYSMELTELVMNRERLSARIAVHDGVGHVLLRAKHYLENPDGNAAADLYVLLRQTNEMLCSAGEFPEEYVHDPLDLAVQLSRGIGVNVLLEGTVPEGKPLHEIFGQAIRECAMNAVKHADGNELDVTFAETPEQFTVTLCSNGSPSEKPVVFTGGLRSLREAVQRAGGTLSVQPLPRFTVMLALPK